MLTVPKAIQYFQNIVPYFWLRLRPSPVELELVIQCLSYQHNFVSTLVHAYLFREKLEIHMLRQLGSQQWASSEPACQFFFNATVRTGG